MLNQYFAFNLSFYAFLTTPEKFSPNLVFRLEDGLSTMLVRRNRPVVWN